MTNDRLSFFTIKRYVAVLVFIILFKMLTVLYSNSNEIIHLIESVCGFHVSPLGCIDEEEGVDNLLLFDILFYEKPQHDWTTS